MLFNWRSLGHEYTNNFIKFSLEFILLKCKNQNNISAFVAKNINSRFQIQNSKIQKLRLEKPLTSNFKKISI